MFEPVPNQVDLVEQEHRVLDFWKRSDAFRKLQAKNQGNATFSFIDGPITANNPMGVHHAWGRTYKDIFQRYRAMRGMDERWQNGFDCQGLWVEVEVEKERGFQSKRDIEEFGLAEFVNLCKQRVLEYSAVQTAQSIRLGYCCLLYTSDAADDLLCVDLGGRRLINKKNNRRTITMSPTNKPAK